MKQIFLLIVVIFSSHIAFAKEKKIPHKKPPTIKVLIKNHSEGALIEAKGPYKVFNPENGKLLSIGFRGKKYFTLPLEDGLKWGEGYPGVYQILITPSSNETSILVDGIEYKGTIAVFLFNNQVHLINEVDIENYISSILTNTFYGQTYPHAVLKSLAIIFRTNAYHTALANQDALWHVQAEKEGYMGFAKRMINVDIDKAVENTKHLVMTYKSQPFACGYTQNSAGKIASYSAIYRVNTPGPIGVDFPLNKKKRDLAKWKFSLTKEEMAKACNLDSIKTIQLYVDKDSTRIYGVRVNTPSSYKDYTYKEFQEVLGKEFLKSNDFTIRILNNQIAFEGYGEGNGVGFCLTLASEKAKEGTLTEKLLAEFFPLTLVQKIDSFENTISLSK